MITQSFDTLFTTENILKAHIKGRISKRQKRPIVRFEISLLENIYELYDQITSGKYKIEKYHSFTIFEPKQREIQTLLYRDRIVQHVICDNMLAPYFSSRAILDNTVCQIDKGTHFALARFENNLRKFIHTHGTNGYILKCDIHKYFPTIPHAQLKELVSKHIKDKRIRNFVCMIIDSYHTSPRFLEKYNVAPLEPIKRHPFVRDMVTTGRGIPIGNQTSQVFGMFYLDKIDRLIKEKLRVKIYSRYMDDFVLVHEDKNFLKKALAEIHKTLDTLGVRLNDKTHIFPLKNGLTFLGFRYQVNENGKLIKKVSKKTVTRFKSRAKLLNRAYAEGLIDLQRVNCSLIAYHGHLKHANCYKLEQNLKKRIKVAEIAQQLIAQQKTQKG